MRPTWLIAGMAGGALLFHQYRERQRAQRFAAASLETLLRAIDANDEQTGAHVRRVATYALIIADTIAVSEEMRRTIELTALFHDIGKIHEALFDVTRKERGLTPAERREIATHPIRGADVLAPIANFFPDLAKAVLAHHEHWDGTGYPRAIRGGHIPLAARVVMLADTFDAITHDRRYRQGSTAREAADIILQGRGTQFDPDLVDLMLLPPVFDQLTHAHRVATSGVKSLPNRRDAKGDDDAPRVNIRWRSRSQPPRLVREQMADAR